MLKALVQQWRMLKIGNQQQALLGCGLLAEAQPREGLLVSRHE
jgi:hypothetical protein